MEDRTNIGLTHRRIPYINGIVTVWISMDCIGTDRSIGLMQLDNQVRWTLGIACNSESILHLKQRIDKLQLIGFL